MSNVGVRRYSIGQIFEGVQDHLGPALAGPKPEWKRTRVGGPSCGRHVQSPFSSSVKPPGEKVWHVFVGICVRSRQTEPLYVNFFLIISNLFTHSRLDQAA